MRWLTVVFWLSLSLPITPCLAAPPEPYSCRSGFFGKTQGELQLAEVVAETLHFYSDVKGCSQRTAQCRDKAYVIHGDQLIINAVRDGWACAWFQGKKRETVGWIDAAGLKFLQNEQSQDTAGWLGTWRFHDKHISITNAGKSLRVQGKARWYGGITGEIVHYGMIDGEISPAGGRAHLTTGGHSCAADFRLIGRYMAVNDNGKCGGANVRFNGVYMNSR